ncbi:MAG TPA: hypothetical protein VJM12_13990 [Pyrinomonadaceae bacterium]|nr:hypothetical protein [Pyrinomonadaceae bacterium]
MSKREPTRESFEKLLLWLEADPEKAGEKYEKIRLRIIRIFACQECCDAEDLADQTINVVTSKIDWLSEHYEGEPALYFYGVAKNIQREQLKRKRRPPPPPPDPTPNDEVCSFLDDCLDELTAADRELILQYHEGQKREKINNRKNMAAIRQISLNALRLKAYHIHSRLKECVERRIRHA